MEQARDIPATQAIATLEARLTPRRRERFREALGQRTRHLTVVLEDIYQHHNADAVVRSCEAFGIQDLHLIELANPFRLSDNVTRGAHQWIDLHAWRYPGLGELRRAASRRDLGDFPPEPAQAFSARTLQAIRRRGYRIVATDPGARSQDVAELPLEQPVALLIGNEMQGLTPAAIAEADLTVHLPMPGLTQSLNLSVFTAICVATLSGRLRREFPPGLWQLPAAERQEVHLRWLKASVTHAGTLLGEATRDTAEHAD